MRNAGMYFDQQPLLRWQFHLFTSYFCTSARVNPTRPTFNIAYTLQAGDNEWERQSGLSLGSLTVVTDLFLITMTQRVSRYTS